MNDPVTWRQVAARIVPGHQVASGLNGDPHFPGGTLRMQTPHFLARGLNLAAYHSGTLNVSIAPLRYRMLAPRLTFRAVKWHPAEPAEDFSFLDVRLVCPDAPAVVGLIYHPHPDTKPAHFQQPDVLELLLPFVDGLAYETAVRLEIPAGQMLVTSVRSAAANPHDGREGLPRDEAIRPDRVLPPGPERASPPGSAA